MLFLVSLSELFSAVIPLYIFCESLSYKLPERKKRKKEEGTNTLNHWRKGESYRKTKKGLGGLFGLLGSFLSDFAFLVNFTRLLSALSAAFRFPTFLKKRNNGHDTSNNYKNPHQCHE
jgi:hypothetical protein